MNGLTPDVLPYRCCWERLEEDTCSRRWVFTVRDLVAYSVRSGRPLPDLALYWMAAEYYTGPIPPTADGTRLLREGAPVPPVAPPMAADALVAFANQAGASRDSWQTLAPACSHLLAGSGGATLGPEGVRSGRSPTRATVWDAAAGRWVSRRPPLETECIVRWSVSDPRRPGAVSCSGGSGAPPRSQLVPQGVAPKIDGA